MDTNRKGTEKKQDNSFLSFLQFRGKKGRKDVILLFCGYLFLLVFFLLISFFGENDLPIELTYAVFGLPFVFFGFAFIFWILKRFFSYLYQKIGFFLFVFICTFLFLFWNLIVSCIFLEVKNFHEVNKSGIAFIPIIIWLAISVYLISMMIWYTLEKIGHASFNIKLIYILVNILIACSTYYFFKVQNELFKAPNTSGYLSLYVECLIIHLILYSMLWLVCLLKGYVFFLVNSKK